MPRVTDAKLRLAEIFFWLKRNFKYLSEAPSELHFRVSLAKTSLEKSFD